MTSKLLRTSSAGFTAIVALALASAGCGGAGARASSRGTPHVSPNEVVAQVGGASITRATVNKWMNTLATADYYLLSKKQAAPAGLVSDPPNFPRCVSSLEAAIAHSPLPGFRTTGTQLLTKCQQLYRALRAQATSFLVQAQWVTAVLRDLGVTATEQEVLKLYRQTKERGIPPGSEKWGNVDAADIVYVAKLDVLAQKMEVKQRRGGSAFQRQFAEVGARWTERTTCQPGYVVEHCSQYKGEPLYASTQPASVLTEQVVALATGRCVNFEACSKE